jgi:hypothetical protein
MCGRKKERDSQGKCAYVPAAAVVIDLLGSSPAIPSKLHRRVQLQ